MNEKAELNGAVEYRHRRRIDDASMGIEVNGVMGIVGEVIPGGV